MKTSLQSENWKLAQVNESIFYLFIFFIYLFKFICFHFLLI